MASEEKTQADKPRPGYVQWAQLEGGPYSPAGKSTARLEPGYYDIIIEQNQQYFLPIRARTDSLLEFPDSASKEVLDGIQNFWDREAVFNRYGMPYKRGILLWGPPGSGKSCTLQLVARDVVKRGGVVVTYNPACFLTCYRSFRDIQPDTHMVVLLEDFESILKQNESRLLNLLDGVEDLDKVVFLATTNYPERLEARIINRPSRFDQIVHVPHPSIESRILYIESLLKEGDEVDAEMYAKDTARMSLAHLKELFVSTIILGSKYDDALARLQGMYLNKANSMNEDNYDGTTSPSGDSGMFL